MHLGIFAKTFSRGTLTETLDAVLSMWRWGFYMQHAYIRNFSAPRDHVIQKRGRKWLAVVVIGDFFVKRRSESLCNAADNLGFDNYRVYPAPTIVDNDIIENLHFTGARIDCHDPGVGGIRERTSASFGFINGRNIEAGFFAFGQSFRVQGCRFCYFGQRNCSRFCVDTPVG